MKQSAYVFRTQLALFLREKGMIGFYIGSIIVIGVFVPIFIPNILTSIIMASFLTVIFLRPIIADSMAGERERKTLESLLATPINGRGIVWGKAVFGLLFATCFFTMALLCIMLTSWLAKSKTDLSIWAWLGILAMTALSFAAISIAGVYKSAMSPDLRTANQKITLISYVLVFLAVIFPAVVLVGDVLTIAIIGIALAVLYAVIIGIYGAKIAKMRQSDYFENVKIKASGKFYESHSIGVLPKSQFMIVFKHELRYLKTLKSLLFNFAILLFAPTAFALLFAGDLNIAVLITAFMIPRIPSNLISYSVGGEKVYKTGESLLATPLHVRPMFLAKSAVPLLVSAVMLVISAGLTLIAANVFGNGEGCAYTVPQLVLLFPVSIMSCITMVFMSGILSAIMKTPRKAYLATSVIGMLYVAPVAAIVYLPINTLLWSLVYCAVLLICNIVCMFAVSDKISRPQLMARL